MKQIKKIAITNEKGGVGKTMTAVNLSACLAQRGYRVLLIDADPQGYATLNYDVDVSPSLLEVLRGQVACTKAVQTTRFGVDVLPSDRTLSVIEEDLIRQKMNGAPYLNTLEKALEDLPDYDFVIIDCPPQGGRLMDIVHYYADAIIMPMFAEDYGIHALTLKAEAIADIRRKLFVGFLIVIGCVRVLRRKIDQCRIDQLKSAVLCGVICCCIKPMQAANTHRSANCSFTKNIESCLKK